MKFTVRLKFVAFLLIFMWQGCSVSVKLPSRDKWDRIMVVEHGQKGWNMGVDGVPEDVKEAIARQEEASSGDLLLFSKDGSYIDCIMVHSRAAFLRLSRVKTDSSFCSRPVKKVQDKKGGWRKAISGYGDVDVIFRQNEYFLERYVGKWPEGEGVLYSNFLVFGNFRYGEPIGVCECYGIYGNRRGGLYLGTLKDAIPEGKGIYFGSEIVEGTFKGGVPEGDVRIWRPKEDVVIDCCIVDGFMQDSYISRPDTLDCLVGLRPVRPDRQLTDAQEKYLDQNFAIFKYKDYKPCFDGGDANAFSKWVNERLVYPDDAKTLKKEGRVVLQFIIDTDGTLCNAKILRGVWPSLDEEALRVVLMSPKWSQGWMLNNDGLYYKPSRVTYVFPVIFRLPEE